MDGNIACGGSGSQSELLSCISFINGSWSGFTNLNYERYLQSSWGRPNPPYSVTESHLFGGWKSLFTSEVATTTESTKSYNITDTR